MAEKPDLSSYAGFLAQVSQNVSHSEAREKAIKQADANPRIRDNLTGFRPIKRLVFPPPGIETLNCK
jgi:hypothetical protein